MSQRNDLFSIDDISALCSIDMRPVEHGRTLEVALSDGTCLECLLARDHASGSGIRLEGSTVNLKGAYRLLGKCETECCFTVLVV